MNLRNILKRSGNAVSDAEYQKIEEHIGNVLSYEPRIGILGKTGVGKSSLCNALFGADTASVNDVEACTRTLQEITLQTGTKKIHLVDVPGVGENRERDKEYFKLYSEILPEMDVVLWLIKADDRSYSNEQTFFENLIKPHIDQGKKFFFVISQADKTNPVRGWDWDKSLPSDEQIANLERKKEDIKRTFSYYSRSIVAISAEEKYNLSTLMATILMDLPPEKRITTIQNLNKEVIDDQVKVIFEDGLELVLKGVWNLVTGRPFKAIKNVVEGVVSFFTGGCFITTAVCHSLKKEDDCIELQTFRNFRDNWLIHEADGNYLIQEYYDIAPKIVDSINTQSQADVIYENIWKSYLKDAYIEIQANKNQVAKTIYMKMVRDLQGKYLS